MYSIVDPLVECAFTKVRPPATIGNLLDKAVYLAIVCLSQRQYISPKLCLLGKIRLLGKMHICYVKYIYFS